jgi:hypothetical protein
LGYSHATIIAANQSVSQSARHSVINCTDHSSRLVLPRPVPSRHVASNMLGIYLILEPCTLQSIESALDKHQKRRKHRLHDRCNQPMLVGWHYGLGCGIGGALRHKRMRECACKRLGFDWRWAGIHQYPSCLPDQCLSIHINSCRNQLLSLVTRIDRTVFGAAALVVCVVVPGGCCRHVQSCQSVPVFASHCH